MGIGVFRILYEERLFSHVDHGPAPDFIQSHKKLFSRRVEERKDIDPVGQSAALAGGVRCDVIVSL